MNAYGGTPDLAIYSASKAALALLTRNAAHAHRFDHIRINGIHLGWVDTPAERQMQSVTLGLGEEWLAKANAAPADRAFAGARGRGAAGALSPRRCVLPDDRLLDRSGAMGAERSRLMRNAS